MATASTSASSTSHLNLAFLSSNPIFFDRDEDKAAAVCSAVDHFKKGGQGFWDIKGEWQLHYAVLLGACEMVSGAANVDAPLSLPELRRLLLLTAGPDPHPVLVNAYEKVATSSSYGIRNQILKHFDPVGAALTAEVHEHVTNRRAALADPAAHGLQDTRRRGLTHSERVSAMQEVPGFDEAMQHLAQALASDPSFIVAATYAAGVEADWLTVRVKAIEILFPLEMRSSISDALANMAKKVGIYTATTHAQGTYASPISFSDSFLRHGHLQDAINEAITIVRGQSSAAANKTFWPSRKTKRVPSELSPKEVPAMVVMMQQLSQDSFTLATRPPVTTRNLRLVRRGNEEEIERLERELEAVRFGSGDSDSSPEARVALKDQIVGTMLNLISYEAGQMASAPTIAAPFAAPAELSPSPPSVKLLGVVGRLRVPLARLQEDVNAYTTSGVGVAQLDHLEHAPFGSAASATASACHLQDGPLVDLVALTARAEAVGVSVVAEALKPGSAVRRLVLDTADTFDSYLRRAMNGAYEEVALVWTALENDIIQPLSADEQMRSKANPTSPEKLFLDNLRVIGILASFLAYVRPELQEALDPLFRRLGLVFALCLYLEDEWLVSIVIADLVRPIEQYLGRDLNDARTGWCEAAIQGLLGFALGAGYACSINRPTSAKAKNKRQWLEALCCPGQVEGVDGRTTEYLTPCFASSCRDTLIAPAMTPDGKVYMRVPTEDLRISVGAHASRRGAYLPLPLFRLILRRQTHPCPVQWVESVSYVSCHLLLSFFVWGYILHYRCKTLRGKTGL